MLLTLSAEKLRNFKDSNKWIHLRWVLFASIKMDRTEKGFREENNQNRIVDHKGGSGGTKTTWESMVWLLHNQPLKLFTHHNSVWLNQSLLLNPILKQLIPMQVFTKDPFWEANQDSSQQDKVM